MVIDLIFAALLALTFLVLGSVYIRKNQERSNLDLNILLLLSGITLCLFISSTFVKIGILNDYLILTLSAIFFLSTIYKIYKRDIRISLTLRHFWNSSLLIPTFTYAFLLNNSLFSTQLRLRNGPDTVGILSSARYLCENSSLENLKETVKNQLGNPNFEEILKSPIDIYGNSIYKIASFTDQVNAEFLLGAKRVGLPSIGATYCNIGGPEALFRFSNSIILISIFLITLIVYTFLSKYKVNFAIKLAISIIASLNINLLSATLEGGIAQVITIPFFLYFILALFQKNHRSAGISFFNLLVVALTTYYDLLFFVGLVFLVYVAVNHKEILHKDRFKLYRYLIYAASLATLLLPTEMFRIINEIVVRSNSIAWGGWDQGKKPTPANFMGFINWLPADGVTNFSRSFGLIVFEIIINACLVLTIVRFKERFSFFVITLSCFYILLITKIYIIGNSPYNNYIALKVGAYLAPFSALVIGSLMIRKTLENQANLVFLKSRIPMMVGVLFLLLNLSAVTSWISDWNRNSFVSRIDPNLEAIFEEYDVEVEGFNGAGTIQFILQGNLHYGNKTRAFSVPVERTPGRQLVYLVNKKEDVDYRWKKFTSIYKTDEFIIWKNK